MGLEQYALHLLTFIFGYVTCRTFYFFKSARASVTLLKVVQLVSLAIFLKCIEEYSYAGAEKLNSLLKCGVLPSDEVYKKIEIDNELQIESLKKRGIATIIALHPEYFRSTLEFDNWESAMTYLKKNKKATQAFLS